MVKDDVEWIVDSVEDLGIPHGIQPPVDSLKDPNIQQLADGTASLRERRVSKGSSIGEAVPFICVDAKTNHKMILILIGKNTRDGNSRTNESAC